MPGGAGVEVDWREVSEGWLRVPHARVDFDSSHPIGLEDTNTLL